MFEMVRPISGNHPTILARSKLTGDMAASDPSLKDIRVHDRDGFGA